MHRHQSPHLGLLYWPSPPQQLLFHPHHLDHLPLSFLLVPLRQYIYLLPLHLLSSSPPSLLPPTPFKLSFFRGFGYHVCECAHAPVQTLFIAVSFLILLTKSPPRPICSCITGVEGDVFEAYGCGCWQGNCNSVQVIYGGGG
ncbi:hypothetical protein BDZ91DRAFT_88799 [Kalaharituber pfeilii]|nr:hypothetical protein BDZ91DRAFT_88799 [Kalaharituber pfeilii]